jgi:Zn-dependent protease with chaperone function
MPILLVFALTAACVPVRWQPPLLGGGEEVAAGFAAGTVALSLVVALLLRAWVVRTLRREPGRKIEVVNTYSWYRRLMFFANIGLVALAILVFGWGWFVQKTFVIDGRLDIDGHPLLAPFAELGVPLPYFLVLFGAWTLYYDAERALHRTTVLGPTDRAFWGRAGYFFHHLRQFLLLVMLPVMLFVTQQTVARFAPETTAQAWYRLGSLALIPLLILFMPLLIKPLLGLQSMPAGPARDRLEALARRLHFRCTDFLLWPTHGASANAMIVGLLPRVRYVIFTDRILEELRPEEIDAVFGHEVGHAKHGHIGFYALFLLLSMTVLAALLMFVELRVKGEVGREPEWPEVKAWLVSHRVENWAALPPVALVAAYVFLVFGFLSRRCERQADVYGCRAVSCADPNCAGHDAATRYPERARGLCPTGIRSFVRALEQVGYINGHAEEQRRLSPARAALLGVLSWLRHWVHSTMQRRVNFLLSLIGNPARERRFQRSVAVLRWGLILTLLLTLYALGESVTWQKLLNEL